MPYGPLEEDVQTPSLPGINQGGELDPKIAQLLEIMKLLGNPTAPTPPPQPEPLKKWQNILFGGTGRDFLGSIGDSLAAQSSVLAGGAPPAMGAHAMQVRQRQMDQMKLMEDYKSQVERQNSDQENFKRQIALQFMQGQNQMDVAGARQQSRPLRFLPTTVNINGVPTRVVDVYDASGNYLGQNVSGEAGYAPFVQPAIPGVSGPTIIPRTVEPGGGTRDVGKTPPPPPNIVNALAMDKTSLEAIGMMDTAWQTLQQKTKGQTLIGKLARERVGSSRYGGAFNQTRDYAAYRSVMANSLNAYVKAQTGAQFSIKEMDRYASLYPEAWDDVELKNTKMESLRQRAVADMREKVRNYPAAAETGAGTPSTSNPVDDILNEWDATHAQTP